MKNAEKKFSRLFIAAMALMSFWIVYAVAQMLLIYGLSLNLGIKEIIVLILAKLFI